jgi:hypothetical protein
MAFPLLLVLPLLMGNGAHREYLRYALLGFIGIALSEVFAISRYIFENGLSALNSVSGGVILVSFVAMTVFFATMLAIVFSLNYLFKK